MDATVLRGNGTKEGEEWIAGERKHRKARRKVADQLVDLLTKTDMGGGRTVVAMRVRSVIEAENAGDLEVIRASYMELSLASACTVASLDLTTRTG